MYVITLNIKTSNKVAIFYSYKKAYNSKSWCKCQKQKVKYIKYFYFSICNYGNISTIEKSIKTAVI